MLVVNVPAMVARGDAEAEYVSLFIVAECGVYRYDADIDLRSGERVVNAGRVDRGLRERSARGLGEHETEDLFVETLPVILGAFAFEVRAT